MKRARIFGGPGLFDDVIDGANHDVNVSQSAAKKNTTALGRHVSPTSGAPRIFQDLPRTPEPKRRKRYQFGNLQLDPRERGPDVRSFRYFETVDGIRKRRKSRVGTVEEYPSESDALLDCEHLRMRANAENPLSNVTMRGLIDRFSKEVLAPCLDVPVGGEVSEGARLQYSTACNYRSHLRCYIRPRWENYKVRDFEKPEMQSSVETWLHSLRRSTDTPDGLAPKSVGQVSAALRVVFKFGVKWGYLKFNPFSDKRIELPRGCTKRLKKPIQLSPADFLLLISNLYLREELAVKFDGWLASRVSEPFGVKWEDLELESGVVRFRRGYVQARFSHLKTEASRTEFPLPEDVVELLRRWQDLTRYNRPSDYVFASEYTGGRPFSPRTLMNNIQRVARSLGLPHIGWHTLRHSFCRWAKDAGLQLDDLKTLVRHETGKMALEIYGGPELASTRKLQARVMRHVKKEARKNKRTENGLRLQLQTA